MWMEDRGNGGTEGWVPRGCGLGTASIHYVWTSGCNGIFFRWGRNAPCCVCIDSTLRVSDPCHLFREAFLHPSLRSRMVWLSSGSTLRRVE